MAKERDQLEGDRWPRVRERPLAFRWWRLKKKLSPCLFVCSTFCNVVCFLPAVPLLFYLLLFVHCLTGSNISNPIAFARSRWTPGFSSPECKTVWFLLGSQAVTHHDWRKEKSALSPLLNMNNKSVHPRSPLSPSNESCWLRPLLSLFPILFLFLLSFRVNQGPTLHVGFYLIRFVRSLSCESHRLELLESQLKLNLAELWG